MGAAILFYAQARAEVFAVALRKIICVKKSFI